MEELDPPDDQKPRCSVKELVARIQQKQQNEAANYDIRTDRSESSDDEDTAHGPAYRSHSHNRRPSGALSPPPFEAMPADAPPRSRCGVYSPATVQAEVHHEVTPVYRYEIRNADLSSRFAKLRMLDAAAGVAKEMPGMSTRVLNVAKLYEHPQDVGDNNDSGYSTKVYGSSKGNSPSLSGEQGEGECMRSSSLV